MHRKNYYNTFFTKQINIYIYIKKCNLSFINKQISNNFLKEYNTIGKHLFFNNKIQYNLYSFSF